MSDQPGLGDQEERRGADAMRAAEKRLQDAELRYAEGYGYVNDDGKLVKLVADDDGTLVKLVAEDMAPDVGIPGVLTTSASGGQKYVKPERYSLIPTGPLADLARLYGFGATRYRDRNWENGFEWSKAKDALMRHLELFWSGHDIDDGPGGSGLPHITAVAFWAFALHEFGHTHPELDDRPHD